MDHKNSESTGQEDSQKTEQEQQLEVAKGCLYDKSEQCPICQHTFKARATRPSKVQYVTSELDLKAIYKPVQPAYYEVIICDQCGYAAVSSKFSDITNSQAERIKKLITPRFKPRQYPEVYDTHVAIDRHKLAFICASAMEAPAGEKAFICMKIAWLYRDLGDTVNEEQYLRATYEGFQEAYGGDSFPLCGLDEYTLMYMLANLAKRFGDDSDAMRYLGKIITSKEVNERLKQRALDLKDIFKNAG